MGTLDLDNPHIRTLVNNALGTNDESIVVGMWNTFLPCIFTVFDGYEIRPETRSTGGKSDLVVLRINNNQANNNQAILVIECKNSLRRGTQAWLDHEQQLLDYLDALNCTYGMVSVGTECKFYIKNGIQILPLNNEILKLDKKNEFNAIIEHLTQLKNYKIMWGF